MPAADGFPEFAADGTPEPAKLGPPELSVEISGQLAGNESPGNKSPESSGKTAGSPLREIQRHWYALRATEWVVLALLVSFAFFRFWQALRPPNGVWEDSLDYEANAGFSLLSKSFWAGSRPPLAPLLWKITGTPTSYVIAQTALAVLAWGFLAVTVGALVPRGWRRVLAASAVLAFACTLPVSEWDWSVLSESLALSALAAIFAFTIRFVRTTNYAGLLVAAFAFALARDEDIWTTALLGVSVLVIGLVVLRSWREPRGDGRARGDGARGDGRAEGDGRAGGDGAGSDGPRGERPRGDGVGYRKTRDRPNRPFAEATVALGTSLLVLALIVEVPAVTSQRDVTNIVDNLIVRIFPFHDRVAWFAAHGMPESAQVDQLAAGTANVPGTATLVSPDLDSSDFSALNTWIQSDGPSTYTLWLLEHPAFAIGAPFSKPPLTFNDASGNIAFYSAPNRISTSFLDRLLYPGFWGEWATLALALAFTWWRFGRRRSRRCGTPSHGSLDTGGLGTGSTQPAGLGTGSTGAGSTQPAGLGTGSTGTESMGAGGPAAGSPEAARFGRGRAGHRYSKREIWAVVIIAAIGPVAMLLAWQGDGQEVTRHMVEGAVEMRLGILLVLIVAVLGGRPAGATTTTTATTPAAAAALDSASGLDSSVL